MLVFGGGAASTFDTVQALNPGGKAQVLGKLPTPASDLTALEIQSSDYVIGGYDGQTTVGSVVKTSDGRRFDHVADLPAAVRYPAVAAIGSTIYVFGGELAGGRDTAEIQAVDTASGRTSVVGRLPDTLAHASAVDIGGTIYLLGGRSNGSTSDGILRFDPASHSAAAAGRLPTPVTNSAAAVIGDTGYLVGGLDSALHAVDSVITVR
jgi:N-acetylneuraminic acid mutarotase